MSKRELLLAFLGVFFIAVIIRRKFTLIRFYIDENCETEVNQINWGYCVPGNTYNVTLYCKNVGFNPVTLRLTTANWSPAIAEQYIHGDWSYTPETEIRPGQVMPIDFFLTVDEAVTGITSFSFDFIIQVKGKQETTLYALTNRV